MAVWTLESYRLICQVDVVVGRSRRAIPFRQVDGCVSAVRLENLPIRNGGLSKDIRCDSQFTSRNPAITLLSLASEQGPRSLFSPTGADPNRFWEKSRAKYSVRLQEAEPNLAVFQQYDR